MKTSFDGSACFFDYFAQSMDEVAVNAQTEDILQSVLQDVLDDSTIEKLRSQLAAAKLKNQEYEERLQLAEAVQPAQHEVVPSASVRILFLDGYTRKELSQSLSQRNAHVCVAAVVRLCRNNFMFAPQNIFVAPQTLTTSHSLRRNNNCLVASQNGCCCVANIEYRNG